MSRARCGNPPRWHIRKEELRAVQQTLARWLRRESGVAECHGCRELGQGSRDVNSGRVRCSARDVAGHVPERRPLTPARRHGCGHNLSLRGRAGCVHQRVSRRASLPARLRYTARGGGRRLGRCTWSVRVVQRRGCGSALASGRFERVTPRRMLAVIHGEVRIPWPGNRTRRRRPKGRSALDGLMLMANAVEFLREHVPAPRAFIHRDQGRRRANIVRYASCFLRAPPSMTVLNGIWERILKWQPGRCHRDDSGMPHRQQ